MYQNVVQLKKNVIMKSQKPNKELTKILLNYQAFFSPNDVAN